MDGRVEAAARALARGERELDDAAQVGAGRERPVAVQARKLRVLPEAGEEGLEPVELVLGRFECVRSAVGLDEELDLGAHRAERAALDHDVLVTVSGGSVTTRTDADAGAALAEYDAALWVARVFAAAICDRRTCSSLL